MNRRTLLAILVATAVSIAGGVWLAKPVEAPTGTGLISLSPPLTETLIALGATDQLIGRSDYCLRPEVAHLPGLGTSLGPNLEAIVALNPGLILADASAGTRADLLEPLAPLELIDWLTLEEVAASVRKLGAITGTEPAAEELADRLLARLDVPIPDGPSALVVLSLPSGGPVWFMKRNSMHGSALHAAGFVNAVNEDVSGPPNISLERLIKLDPDRIVFLLPESAQPEDVDSALAPLRELPLSAMQNDRVHVLFGDYLGTGPRILDLVDALAALPH
ncbi:MAG: ABC transporter substrate-binding protein [Proteobacteria bacterium]|nr:ABC transporter substrate-binding protein [Pseudomonadota bacterium]